MFSHPDHSCSSSLAAPTEFRDLALNVTIPVNHPAEPLLVFYTDGSFEWVFDGDVDFITTSNLNSGREVVNAVTVDSVLASLDQFVRNNPVQS